MTLAKEAILEFIVLYEKNFGIALSYEEASVKAVQVFKLMKIIRNSTR